MWLLLKEILGEKGFDIKERLSYLDRNSTSFKKGLTVTTFYLAKGLEFDQVFAVFPQLQRKKDKWYDEAEKWRYDRLCKSQKAEKSTLTSM